MEGNTITKNNKLAGWIEDFVSAFSKKDDKEETHIEKIAEINLDDLEKIVWNDETFYVNFDDQGASIINGFGNTVTSLKDVHTMEEVNNRLNAKQIVSSNESEFEVNAEMENEINKALTYMNDESVEEIIDVNNTINKNEEVESEELEVLGDDVKESTASFEKIEKTVESMVNEKSTELFSKLAEIINEQVEERVDAAIKQFYARNENITNDYDIPNIAEQEIEKSNQQADETVKAISEENNVDRSTPSGKYKNTGSSSKESFSENVNIENEEFELSQNDSEIFKQAKCPFCRSELVKSGMNENMVNIKCSGCDVKYNVDTNTEKIYIK